MTLVVPIAGQAPSSSYGPPSASGGGFGQQGGQISSGSFGGQQPSSTYGPPSQGNFNVKSRNSPSGRTIVDIVRFY